MKRSKNLCILVILDGFGYKNDKKGNAILNASMPFWNTIRNNHFFTLLKASGTAVGLPKDFIGNSEVGHLTIGSGRVVESILSRFNKGIDNGSFFNNEMIINHFNNLIKSKKSLHIMGLLSNAGVHSHTKHLYAFLELAKRVGLKDVFIHAFLDGRDTAPFDAKKYLDGLGAFLNKLGIGKLASLQGRFYAMDRDKNWDRTKKGYDVICAPQIEVEADWKAFLEKEYLNGNSDEFIEPTRLVKNGFVHDGDGIVFLNFRADRARQLAQAFLEPSFDEFMIDYPRPKPSFFISTIRYREDFKRFNNDVLFEQPEIKNTLLDVLAANYKKVFIIAETEKYAHVTYFFRGERDIQTSNETRILVPSIKARNYIDHPEMSAPAITLEILKNLESNPNEFYLVNYANADMVGHSANFEATIKACECLDKQLSSLYEEFVKRRNGIMIISADHGNAEEMIDPKTGEFLGMHTTNPVPFLFISNDDHKKVSLEPILGLSSIAPTILNLLDLSIPHEMWKKLILD